MRFVIQLRVLGPVEVSLDGGPAPAPLLWRKHLALLVYLALEGGRTHARDALITLLWPDSDTGAGRHSLNEAIRVLRRAAGDAAVESSSDRVCLQASHVALDTTALRAALARGDPAAAAELVRGPPLDGLAVPGATDYEDWLAAKRLALRSRSVEALVGSAEAAMRTGNGPEASELALRALAIAPDSDAAVRQAMRALALNDDRANALEVFARFRDRLAHDFDAEAEPATLALAARIGAGKAGFSRRSHERVERRASGSPHRVLVGRERELDGVMTAWTDARNGQGARGALLIGDPGAGRSRLLEELVARAELDGAAVALARAVPADRDLDDASLAAIARGGLAAVAGVAAAAPEVHAALRAHLPEWCERFPGPVPPSAGLPRDSLARAVTEIIRAAAGEQPVVIALDDAQWMDERSLATVSAMLRDLAPLPVLVAVTVARHAASPALDELRSRIGRDVPGVTVELGALDGPALSALAAAWLPHYTPAEIDRVARRVAADSAGVPLIATELFRAIAHGLEMGDGTGSGSWPAPDRTLDQTLPSPIPDVLSASIRLGCTRLAEDSRLVLLAAAAGPERTTAAAIGAAVGLPSSRIAAALDALEWGRWLVSDARGYTFRARIVRDIVARELMTPGQRRRLAEAMGA